MLRNCSPYFTALQYINNLETKRSYKRKVISQATCKDSPGLVDFVIGLVNSVINLPDGQVKFFEDNPNYRRTVKLICSSKRFWG